MLLLQYPQDKSDRELANKIIALENTAWPKQAGDTSFPTAADTYVTSFVLLENDMAICHVGVRKRVLQHKGNAYLAYGLSEVVTHPQYQNQGLASQTIRQARKFILAQKPDISIFTCAQDKVHFYTRNGWEAIHGACLVGGTKRAPFHSDSLNLIK